MLLHVCCAPCLATARATLGKGGVEGVFFYNPNIHPLLEFRRRVKAVRVYLERDVVEAEIYDSYGLDEFLRSVPWGDSREARCEGCYRLRLGRAAEFAAGRGAGEFTTTLLASREQDRGLVARVGHEMGERFGVKFIEGDLRRVAADERMLRGIYKQQYCGCIFSEEERFRNTAKHLYHPEPHETSPEEPHKN